MKKILFLLFFIPLVSFGQTAKEYYSSAFNKDDKGDYTGAISDYTKAIELDPNYADAYVNRGISKHNLKDYKGAMSDYNKAIELNPNDAILYYNRGNLKGRNLKDYTGAISDYTKSIELDPNYADAYVNRGAAKELIGFLNGACSDWKKAANLGHTNAAKWVTEECNYN